MLRFTWEFTLLDQLHKLSNPILDFIFWLITELGSELILIGIIGLLYYCFNKKQAEKMACIGLSSALFNNFLKSLINAPRPYEVEGYAYLQRQNTNYFAKSAYSSATGQSFPSGHSQNSATIYTAGSLILKQKWIKIVSIILIILVPLSRLYFGVHFPIDTLVGSALGIGIAFGIYYLLTYLDNHQISYFYFYVPIALLSVIALFFDVFKTNPDFYKLTGLFIGFMAAMFIEKKWINFTYDVSLLKKILRIVIGMAIILGLKVGVKAILPTTLLSDFIRYFLISLIAMGIFPFVFRSSHHTWGL